MKTQKLILILLAFLCVFLLAASAFADGPIDPYFAETQPFPLRPRLRAEQSDLTVTLSIPADIHTGEEVTFTASVTGGDGDYTYAFEILSLDYYDAATHTNYLKTHYSNHPESPDSYVASNSLTFTFWNPDTYYVRVSVRDSDGKTGSFPSNYEENVIVTGTDLLMAKVNEIVSSCPSGSDFDKALYLHDYLTSHAYYDFGYNYYSEIGVLMLGTGVCDSYSRAYNILLNEVGIGHGRVKSETHAWNTVSMEGEWYHVDPTWDDPGKVAAPVSGYENHDYFGLPTDVIQQIDDHVITNVAEVPLCTAYECNYAIRTGNLPWHEAVVQLFNDEIEAGERDFSVDLPDRYSWSDETHTYTRKIDEPQINYSLSRYLLERDGLEYRDRAMDITAAYDFSSPYTMNCSASFALNNTDAVLNLPSGLQMLENETLEETNAVVVMISDGCESIGILALASMPNLDEVHIPASVTAIASNAFSGCKDNLLVVTPRNSAAASFASGKNFCIEFTD